MLFVFMSTNFFLFLSHKEYVSLPLTPSAACGNLSVSSCAGPSASCLGHALEQPKHLPGLFRTSRFVQLDIGYKPGSGEGCHGAADPHWSGLVGRGV